MNISDHSLNIDKFSIQKIMKCSRMFVNYS